MIPPIEDWDEEFVRSELASPVESETIEKKASGVLALSTSGKVTGSSREEIAKQVCAFANSGGGFLVFGITKTGELDSGVPRLVGGEPITEWIEKQSRLATTPEITGCAARLVPISGMTDERALLVLHIPSSNRRPHWTDNSQRRIAYIRAGATSEPMPPSVMLDIASRGHSISVDIESLTSDWFELKTNGVTTTYLRPRVTLRAGTICREWAFELAIIDGDSSNFHSKRLDEFRRIAPHELDVFGQQPLFRGRSTPVIGTSIAINVSPQAVRKMRIVAKLFASDADPITRVFRLIDNGANAFTFAPTSGA